MDNISKIDLQMPAEISGATKTAMINQRSEIIAIVEMIWRMIHPDLIQMHKQGLRPSKDPKLEGGWSPLSV